MDQSGTDSFNFGHAFYSKCIQDDENMKARIKAILNQIHENREAIRELHIEFGIKFTDISLYISKLQDNSDYYDDLLKELVERRESLLKMCDSAIGNN